MFNFQEFQEYVQMKVQEELVKDYKDVEVNLHQVQKNNGKVMHGIAVGQKDAHVAPAIYLNEAFEKYQEDGNMDRIMREVIRAAKDHINPPEEYSSMAAEFTNFDSVKDKIVMVVVNTEKNSSMLANVPHQNREDLSLIYKVLVNENNQGITTITIQNEHMKYWDVTTEKLHEYAMKNTSELRPVTVQSMDEVMRELIGEENISEEVLEALFEESPIKEQMYVISNETRTNGAVSMFCGDELSELANKMETDLFILPSSVHECIAVSTDMGTAEMLAEMVREINGEQVSLEDQLSDHVYRFDASTRSISLADTTMKELQSKVSENQEAYGVEEVNREGTRPRHHR